MIKISVELINRITIKKDGVYISTHSSNDTSPFYSVKNNSLTEIYNKEGQESLDKEIIDMCFSYCSLRGNHKSIVVYSKAIDRAINEKNFIALKREYDLLDDVAFSIANRFDQYKNLTKDESQRLHDEIKPKLIELRNRRNEYVANIVKEERMKINGLEILSAECVGGYNDTTVYNVKIKYLGVNETLTLEKNYHDMKNPSETWQISSKSNLTDEEKNKIIQVVSNNPPSIFVDAPPKSYENYDYEY